MKKVFCISAVFLFTSFIYFNQKIQFKQRNPNSIDLEVSDESSNYLFQKYHSTLYCSPPPQKDECPTYTSLMSSKEIEEYQSIFNAKNSDGRPCFIHESFEDSITEKIYSVGRNYQIFKSSQNNIFEIVLPIFFKTSTQDPITIDEQSIFKEKIKVCVQKVSPILTDGNIAIQLKPEIMFTTSLVKGEFKKYFNLTTILNYDSKDYPWNEILLYKSNLDRIDYQNYALDMNCGDIAHELFHLLGLHDEYVNKYGTYTIHPQLLTLAQAFYNSDEANRFDCRVTPGEPNLMKDQSDFISVNDVILGQVGLRSDQIKDILHPSCLLKESALIYTFKSINAYRNRFEDLKKTCLH